MSDNKQERKLIITFFGEDILAFTQNINNAEPCPADYKLDLGLIVIPNVGKLVHWMADYSTERDPKGNSLFATFSLRYYVGEPSCTPK